MKLIDQFRERLDNLSKDLHQAGVCVISFEIYADTFVDINFKKKENWNLGIHSMNCIITYKKCHIRRRVPEIFEKHGLLPITIQFMDDTYTIDCRIQ